jgi:hypothetical protein
VGAAGKRGAGVQQINATSGARVKVGHEEEMAPGSAERIVHVIGSRPNIDKALEQIRNRVGGRPLDNPVAPSLTVPIKSIGALLGPGGQNIRRVREATGARIQIASLVEIECGMTEGRVDIDGTDEMVSAARGMLRERVEEWKVDNRAKGEYFDDWETTVKLAVPFPLVSRTDYLEYKPNHLCVFLVCVFRFRWGI